MESEVQGYLNEYSTLKGQIREALQGLDDEAANWHPLPEGTNSIYVILTHLMGSDNYWVRRVISGEKVQRDRESEFAVSGSFAELLSRWEKSGTESAAILAKLTPEQMAETRAVPGRPDRGLVTIRWCILHQISHYATHLG
ncbi:MAG: DUF664 domain-containing protein, partial [Chloroflexi bacterium]|nr:DUF664 domain-containing protein [Chloroflexota bacterium]